MNDSTRIDVAALVLRVSLGVMFVAHALLKYLVFTPAGTVKFFQSIGLPGPLAYATMAAEIIGGALLILGVYTRVVSFALVPVLIGAFLTLTAIAAGLVGSGRYALDALGAGRAPAALPRAA